MYILAVYCLDNGQALEKCSVETFIANDFFVTPNNVKS